jgi:hypothetical protein
MITIALHIEEKLTVLWERVMRKKLLAVASVVLAFGFVATAQEKSNLPTVLDVDLRMVSASTGNDGLVMIQLKGRHARYKLSCEKSSEECVIPRKEFTYELRTTFVRHMHNCESVSIEGVPARGTFEESLKKAKLDEFEGAYSVYCLDGVD